MDKGSLISTFTEAAKSGWSLRSDVQVLKWLEDFTDRLQQRADNVTQEMQKLLEQTAIVEQDLHNTFNSFRGLANTQFIENRVSEEDEMAAQNSDFVQFSEVGVPAQSYEEDIVPRYKEALFSGWNAYKQRIQKTYRNTSECIPHRVGWSYGQLPHIIGTEEFMRDNSCGLTDDRSSGMEPLEFDSDAEREGIHLAAEIAGTGTLLEGDWSGMESDRDDQAGMEPAVSAALDFKAMLEAALRSPYIPYDNNILSNSNPSSGFNSNINYGLAASQVPGTLHPEHNNTNQEMRPNTPISSIQTSISSEVIGAKHQPVPSSFSNNLRAAIVSGGLFDNEDGPCSPPTEYVHVPSERVNISHIANQATASEKSKSKISANSKQINTSDEANNDEYPSGSSPMSRKPNTAVVSESLFHSVEQFASSSLWKSDHIMSPLTEVSCSSGHTNANEKAKPASTSGTSEKDIPSQGPGKDVLVSSNLSSQLHSALVSGGLFDDEDKLVSSNSMESVHVWSQPSVPEKLFGSILHAKKNEVSASSSISSDLIQTGPNPQDTVSPVDVQVSAAGKPQFTGTEHVKQTLHSKDQVDAHGLIFEREVQELRSQKTNSGNLSLKESLSLFRKGLFDDADTDEDDDIGDLFGAQSSLRQKYRSKEGSLVSGTSIEQGSFYGGVKFNAPNVPLTNLSERHKDDESHSMDAETFGSGKSSSSPYQYYSNIATSVENPEVEGGIASLDDGEKLGTAVNLTVNDTLGPRKDPFPSIVTVVTKELVPPSVAATSALNQSDYDSDSWSSSSSEIHIKSNPILDVKVQGTKVSKSKINNDPCKSASLETKGISDPSGQCASLLQNEGSLNLVDGSSVLESADGVTESTSMSKQDAGSKYPLSASLTDFESLLTDPCSDENRVSSSPTLNGPLNALSKAEILPDNQNKGTQLRVEDPCIVESKQLFP
eukprot:Gb_35896 [translate_table: standard]